MTTPTKQEIQLATRGDYIPAIRKFRERTGCTLPAAKVAIDRAVPEIASLERMARL